MTVIATSRPGKLVAWSLAVLLAVPLAVAQEAWRPIRRLNIADMVYDPIRRTLVMFGGARDIRIGVLDDTWIWDGREWRRAPTATTPPERYNQAMAFDWVRGKVVMFGGARSLDQALGDMWEWDGQDWRQITGIVLPPARVDMSMADDPVRGKVVLYGGQRYWGMLPSPASFRDTWEWDGNQWTQRFPATVPVPDAHTAMAFNPVTGRLAMFGGSNLSGATVYEWDGNDWITIQAGGTIPRAGEFTGPNAMTDPLFRGVLAMYGPRMWLFDGVQWTALPDAPDDVYVKADLVRRELAGLGWGFHPGRLREVRFDPVQGVWSERVQLNGHPGLKSAYDAANRRLVFGPSWTWTQAGWELLPSTQTPPVDPKGLVAWHAGSGQIVYVSDASLAAGQTWVYGPSDWSAVPFTTGPSAATGGTLAADPLGDRLLLWQGNTMWEWTPARQWRALGTGPTTAITGIAFDARRRRFVGCSTSTATPPAFETWEWDAQGWQLVSPPSAPPVTASPQGVSAPAFGGVLLIRADLVSGTGLEVWRYDGADWTKLAVRGSAPPYTPSSPFHLEPRSYAYDASRRRVIASYEPSVTVDPPEVMFELVLEELTADRELVVPGSAVTFQASFAGRGGLPWILLLSATDANGIELGPSGYLGTEVLPLDADPLLLASLGIWMGGLLDAQGAGSFALPVPADPALRGLSFHGAALVIGPGLGIAGISNGVPVQIAW